jgi:hypothetical protein
MTAVTNFAGEASHSDSASPIHVDGIEIGRQRALKLISIP